MKSWSRHWRKSKNVKKQRKYSYNAPLHILRKMMSVRLTKDLKVKYGKRNIPVRKGDRVKIMVGEFKGKLTKVNRVDLKHKAVYVDDAFSVKRDSSRIPVALHPSNLMIMELNLEDKLRKKALEKK